MATHSSILAWRIPWTEEAGGLQSLGCKELDTTEVTKHTHTQTNVRGKDPEGDKESGRFDAFSLAGVTVKFPSCP